MPRHFTRGLFSLKAARNRFVRAMFATAIGLFCFMPSSLSAQTERHSIRLENDSSYGINQVFISPVGMTVWGRDKLGDSILEPADYVYLPSLRLGNYDLMLVDEDGDSCIVSGVEVTANTNWRITNAWLLGCEFHNVR